MNGARALSWLGSLSLGAKAAERVSKHCSVRRAGKKIQPELRICFPAKKVHWSRRELFLTVFPASSTGVSTGSLAVVSETAPQNAELREGDRAGAWSLPSSNSCLSSGWILAVTFAQGDLVACKRVDVSGAACKTRSETNICLVLLIFGLIPSKVSVCPGWGLIVPLGSEWLVKVGEVWVFRWVEALWWHPVPSHLPVPWPSLLSPATKSSSGQEQLRLPAALWGALLKHSTHLSSAYHVQN